MDCLLGSGSIYACYIYLVGGTYVAHSCFSPAMTIQGWMRTAIVTDSITRDSHVKYYISIEKQKLPIQAHFRVAQHL